MAMRAYFDDTGTHTGSAVVGWAGFLGYPGQWRTAEARWRSALSERGLTSFHMADCNALREGYGNRAASDSLIYDLRQCIKETHLFGIVAIAFPAEWDEMIVGHYRDELGTAEQQCFLYCINAARNQAVHADRAPKGLALFFDRGAAAAELIGRTCNAINEATGEKISCEFTPVNDTPALQMADMLAWEAFNDGHNFRRDGEGRYLRAHLQRMIEDKWLVAGVFNRDAAIGARNRIDASLAPFL